MSANKNATPLARTYEAIRVGAARLLGRLGLFGMKAGHENSMASHSLNELVDADGHVVLSDIPADKVRALTAAEPRIRHVPITIPEGRSNIQADEHRATLSEGATMLYNYINNFGIGGNAFNDYVQPALVDDLHQLMSERSMDMLMLRGIACSVDNTAVVDGNKPLTILSALDIVAQGADQPEGHVLVTGFDAETTSLHHRTDQWLIQHPQHLRRAVQGTAPNIAASIYPMLLVYDPSKIEPGGTLQYEAQLAEGVDSWSDALLCAYILPMPNQIPKAS